MQNPILAMTAQTLSDMLQRLEVSFNADLLCINGPISGELVGLVHDEVEELKERRGSKSKLCVMLTTNGGDANSTERMADIFRHNYKEVEFVIPDHAYSAGTILCMSGDKIWMDYFSVLGPIDPQVQNREGRFVPALGYLDKIGELLKKAQNNTISQAEFLILKDFDLAELSLYEQARDLTGILLKKWLVQYKFKNWTVHKSTGKKVTKKEKEERAEQIAKKLSDYNKWKSHGRPLSIKELRELKLEIDDYGSNKDLKSLIRGFHNTFEDFMRLQNAPAMIYSRRV